MDETLAARERFLEVYRVAQRVADAAEVCRTATAAEDEAEANYTIARLAADAARANQRDAKALLLRYLDGEL